MSSIQKVANIEDDISSDACEVFRFSTVDDEIRHVKIDRGKSRDLKYVYRVLLRANAALPSNTGDAHRLVQQAIDTEAPSRLHYATCLGWRPKLDGFVLWDEFISGAGTEGTVLAPTWAEQFAQDHLKKAGTLKSWQTLVAQPAAASSRLIFLAAAAFAAPLIGLSTSSNIGFNLIGLNYAETGIVAAFMSSIVGCDAHEVISEWWTTPAESLKRARLFGDQLFLTGSLVAYPERMGTPRQHERLMALQLGKKEDGRDHARWRGIFVTLLPFPTNFVGSAKANGRLGWSAPCIDIPPACRFSPLLDLPHPSATEADLLPVVETIQRAAAAAERNRGIPIRRYIRYLVKNRTQLGPCVLKLRRRFARVARKNTTAPLPAGLLEQFELLYAGASMAIEAGVLPWKPRQVSSALCACLMAAFKQHRGTQLTPAKIRHTLQAQLNSPSVVARQRNGQFGPDDHPGFYDVIDGRRRYTIHAKAFRRWFGSPTACAAALAWLRTAKLLVSLQEPAVAGQISCEWAERTPRWPDGRVQKSFVFFAPPVKKKAAAKPSAANSAH